MKNIPQINLDIKLVSPAELKIYSVETVIDEEDVVISRRKTLQQARIIACRLIRQGKKAFIMWHSSLPVDGLHCLIGSYISNYGHVPDRRSFK